MRGRGTTRGFVLGLCVYALSLGAVPAHALTVHEFQKSFGEVGSGLGQFDKPVGVAVASSSGYVYVADTGNNRVERFGETGVPLGSFNGSGVYDVEGKTELGTVAGHGGKPGEVETGTLSQPEIVAVDNSTSGSDPSRGDVYVVDGGHGVVDKFTAVGEYVGQIAGAGEPCPRFDPGEAERCSIAGLTVNHAGEIWISVPGGSTYRFSDAVENQSISVCKTKFGGIGKLGTDEEGNLYFEAGRGDFAKSNSSCETLLNPFSEDTKADAVAVDSNAGVVYLDNGTNIESFNLDGSPIESQEPGAPSGSFGSGRLSFSKGLAVDGANAYVYVADQEENDVVIFKAITLPSVAIGSPTEQGPRSLTVNGAVNPEGSTVESCYFEYDTHPYLLREEPHGTKIKCSSSIVGNSGKSPLSVSARIGGLTPQTTYYFRLVVNNGAKLNGEAVSEVFTGPLVEGEWSTGVADNSATVRTRIDPNGGNTGYYIEYAPTISLGSPPEYAPVGPPGAGLGSSSGPQEVSVHLLDLVASTNYYYRVVAVQGGEAFGCLGASEVAGECDTSFTTSGGSSASGGLLDDRGWELVSPPDKRGALIEAQTEQGGEIQAASDGSGVTYITRGPSIGSGTVGHVTYSTVLAKRNASNVWNSTDLTLPGRLPDEEPSALANKFAFEYRLFSPTLSLALVEPALVGTPRLSNEVNEGERSIYLRNDDSGSYKALVSPADSRGVLEPTTEEHSEWALHFLAGTPDLSSVVFKTPMALTEPAVDEESPTISCREAAELKVTEPNCYEGLVQWNLYEWTAGKLGLVNVLPGPGEVVAHGRERSGFPGVRLAGMQDENGRGHGGVQRVISSDGRRIAWTWGEPYTEADLKSYRGLFVRDMVEDRTVQVGGPKAMYQTMSSDGSRIFYIENDELYEYVWEVGQHEGTVVDLTVEHELGEASAEVQESVTDVSEDGSFVYFVAKGVLASGGLAGENNLYLLHETGGVWSTELVAVLSPGDRPSWYAAQNDAPAPAKISSRVSPNGEFLAFMSQRSLTGYDNVDIVSGKRDEEVYLYEFASNRLVCASCNPSGERPAGVFDTPTAELLVDRQGVWTLDESEERDLKTDHWLAGSVPGWDDLNGNGTATYQPRYLSDSGRLFFDSPDALVPLDTNGFEDVYEFEPEGVGGCDKTAVSGAEVYVSEMAGHVGQVVDGCVGLMSSGDSVSESAFLDASENGDDVFFVTVGKLSGADYDKGYDVYDAHVCGSGGVPCVALSESLPACSSGDSCKPPPSQQPEIFGAPPSATFAGIGNVVATPLAPAASKPKFLTNAQKLARALKACRRDRRKRRRLSCERKARRHYPIRSDKRAGSRGRGSR